MKRRGFLGFMGAAVVSGPKAIAKAAVPANISSLSLGMAGIDISGNGISEDMMGGAPIFHDRFEWAKQGLKRIMRLTPWAKQLRLQRTYVHQIDPDTASLRSVSLGSKIRITKRLQFEARLRNERDYYNGVIAGVIED